MNKEQLVAVLEQHEKWLAGTGGQRANLSGADLSRADLSWAKNCKLILARTEILPREGEVIGWKKCEDGVLVKLRVPPEAKRSNALGRKCRAEYVEVLEVVGSKVGVSIHDGKTEYKIGETVKCDAWNTDRLEECGGGIHFYITREEAEAHLTELVKGNEVQ